MMPVIKFRSLFLALLVFTASGYGQAEQTMEQTKLTPKCETLTIEGDESCWLKAGNHDNCWFWNKDVIDEETVTWSGQCRGGKPHGRGKEIWKSAGVERWTSVASYEDGQLQSESRRFANGNEYRASYDKDGELHGLSTYKVNGVVTRSRNYKHGKAHGEFYTKYSDGTISKSSYKDGKEHGVSSYEESNGDYHRFPYVNGETHGESIIRITRGSGKIDYIRCMYSHGKQISCEHN